MDRIGELQEALREAGLDGWLFYDFRGCDPLARSILKLPSGHVGTRRWFYYLPASGEPIKLVHGIEAGALDALPGRKRIYGAWKKLHEELAEILAARPRVAMQYSPSNAIPYISRVDAGTIELVRQFGAEVVSSGDLVQRFEAVVSAEQEKTHVAAAEALGELVDRCFREIARRLGGKIPTTEWDVQHFMLKGFHEYGLVADHDPIVAVDAHAADPHYAPQANGSAQIRPGQLVLIDAWAKQQIEGSIYGDITWVGYTGASVPAEVQKVFEIVRDARDAGLHAVEKALADRTPIRGCDVDDVCRGVIADAGYGEFFIHRTGHSIHETGHGNGANLDNFETRDERRLIPRTCFSIEPGIYLPGRFGVRSEIDVLTTDSQTALVAGPKPQQELVRIV